MSVLDDVKSRVPGVPMGAIRSTYWSYQIWSFIKALFWFPLTFLVVSAIEIREIFKK